MQFGTQVGSVSVPRPIFKEIPPLSSTKVAGPLSAAMF